MTVKKIIGQVHLWLGFTSGLVVFIIAVTGCLYAFQAEISEWTQPFRRVESQQKAFLPPSALRIIAEKELPGKKIHAVQYEGSERAALVSFYDYEPVEYYYLVYVNQYTGEVLEVKNMYSDFFHFVLQGHFYLWLPPEIGQPVVASATLVFVVMLITGIVLWWPKKGKAKQRFTIRWNARWRRKNYDLHNVFGFYSLFITLILALTGLVWGFEWFSKGLYAVTGGEKSLLFEDPKSKIQPAITDQPVDRLWLKLRDENPDVAILEVHFPESDTASIGATINPDNATYYKADYRFFNQYTLKEIEVNQIYGKYSNTAAADKLIRMNYDIHTGAIIGLPGKILAFFASLIAASLPITGFLIWKGRRDKEKKAKPEKKPKATVSRKAVEEVLVNS